MIDAPSRTLAARRAILAVSALTFAAIAVASLIDPHGAAATFDYRLETTNSLSEHRAVYVGLWLAHVVVLGWAAYRVDLLHLGDVAGLLILGQVVGRVLSLLLDGLPDIRIAPVAVAELAAGCLLFVTRPSHGPSPPREQRRTGEINERDVAATIRPFRPTDRAQLEQLWARVFADDPPWNSPAVMIDNKLAVQPELLLVAVLDAAAVVGAVIAGYDGVRGWIYHLAVAPEHRRGGIATQLVRAAESGLRKARLPQGQHPDPQHECRRRRVLSEPRLRRRGACEHGTSSRRRGPLNAAPTRR